MKKLTEVFIEYFKSYHKNYVKNSKIVFCL